MADANPVVYSNKNGGAFDGVPVMQFFLLASLLLSFAIQPISQGLSLKGLSTNGTLSSVLSFLAFSTGGETLVGSLLLFNLREIEKTKGSSKIASQILFATLFQALSSLAFSGLWVLFSDGFANGPYGAIHALVLTYYFTVPSVASVQLFGLTMSNKVFVYAPALHLLLCHGKGSLAAGLSGSLFGLLYELNILNIGKLQVPRSLSSACQNTIGRLMSGPDACKTRIRFGRYVQQMNAQNETEHSNSQSQPHREADFGAVRADEGRPTDPQALQTLESMGFERQLAAEALRQTNNDLNQAMNLLLAQG